MNFAKRFVGQFAASMIALLSCFDRVVRRGELFGPRHLDFPGPQAAWQLPR